MHVKLPRAERIRQVQTARLVANALRVRRKNSVLFAAVAKELGKEWKPGAGAKWRGYALVMEYAEQRRMTYGPLPRLVKKDGKFKLPKEARDEFLMSYEWRKLRMVVLKKRGARCECCGASPKDGTTVLNVDHIKPRKLHPELALDESNLQVLCHACNHGKGNWDQTDWRSA